MLPKNLAALIKMVLGLKIPNIIWNLLRTIDPNPMSDSLAKFKEIQIYVHPLYTNRLTA